MAGVKHESKEIVEKKEGISVSKTKEEMFQYKTDPLEIVQVKMEPEVQLEEFEGNNELPIDCVLEEDPDASCTEDEETLDIPGTSKAQMEDSKVRANLNTENDESDSAGNNETFAKQFYCGYCEYGTSHKGNLIKHLRIHTGEKPFNCKYCDFKCTRKYGLILHEQRHTGKESFTCHYCHYRCTRKDHLITHIRSHTGEKPFKCSICGFECSRKYHLVTHSRIHTGEKPFKCAHCDYATARKDNLGCHIRKKHKEATD